MFLDELKKRNVPSLKSRAEMLELLQREEYGCLPKAPESFVWEAEPGIADNFCAGKATLEKLTFRVVVNGKDFAFPVYLAVPTAEGPHPFFVHINFRSDVPDRYMPTEELIDNGFAVLSFGYEDVTRDDSWNYADVLWNGIQAKTVAAAFEQLSYKEQWYLEKRNAICMTCGRVSPLSAQSTFEDLAVDFEGTTASGAERFYRRTLDKLRLKLLESGVIHTVTLKQTECRKRNKK